MKTPTKFKMGKSKGNFNFNKANDYNLDKYGPSAGETVAGKKFAAFQMKSPFTKKKGRDGKACWKGYRLAGTKKKGGRTVDNCVKIGRKKKR